MSDAAALTRRSLAALTLVAVAIAACGGPTGNEGGGPTKAPAAPTGAGGGVGGGTGGGTGGGLPSHAKVRLVNAYVPLNGDPGPVDVYPQPFVLDGAKPLITVPYGTVSDWFDPTVADEQGDMFLSVYWQGTTGNGNALMSQTETLKGGEMITFFLATASSTQDGGRRYGSMQAFFGHPTGDDFGQPTPGSGKGLLIVDTVGADQVLSDAATHSWDFSLGSGCQKAIGDDQYTLTAIGPGSAATYELDPGSYTGSVHSYVSDSQDARDCANAPLVGNIPVSVVAGETTVLFVHAAKDGDIRTLSVRLEE